MDPNANLMSNDPASTGTNHVEEARGIPQVGRKGGVNRALAALLTVSFFLIVIAVGGYVFWQKLSQHTARTKDKPAAADTLPTLTEAAFNKSITPPPPPPGVATQTTPAASGETPAQAGQPQLTPEQKAAADRAERRKRAPLMAFTQSVGMGGLSAIAGGAGEHAPEASSDNARGALGSALQATRTSDVSARTLADPDMTITQGTFIDCTLETAIDSTLPGMTSCILPRDVYSTSGRVLLLERGSRVVGQYQSGQLRSGMRRIFMLWTRIETPKGVLINLDSPDTDALGRSGVDGAINNHFFLRFGSALLVSLVDDLAQYAVNRQTNGGGTTNNLNFGNTAQSTTDAAGIIVQNTINIPPTLTKAQGGHVGIFVARDLYFGNVYGLAPAQQRN
ncbi:MAG: type IV secretion system protein VirB10 [Nitrospira sp.]|nr:type IV secretion system protein VirB10 [Nitrospira sp.]MBS0194378.1 type IV secretion system protein VirB10 [Pseudomonadota bacterium]